MSMWFLEITSSGWIFDALNEILLAMFAAEKLL